MGPGLGDSGIDNNGKGKVENFDDIRTRYKNSQLSFGTGLLVVRHRKHNNLLKP